MQRSVIICLGSRFVANDSVGVRVYQHLVQMSTAPGIDIIDGGLCGLDLLRLIEGRQRVVFADAIAGLNTDDAIAELGLDAVLAQAVNYGHSAGLPYLLHMLPLVCPAPLPEIVVVGADGTASDATVAKLADRCLQLVQHGLTKNTSSAYMASVNSYKNDTEMVQ